MIRCHLPLNMIIIQRWMSGHFFWIVSGFNDFSKDVRFLRRVTGVVFFFSQLVTYVTLLWYIYVL